MMELTIGGQVFEFNFGMGFLREINKTVTVTQNGVKHDEGLQYKVAGLIDGDTLDLVEVLFMANMGRNPRVTKAALEEYIDNECTDIDALFAEVLDFLRESNATRTIVRKMDERVAKAMDQL